MYTKKQTAELLQVHINTVSNLMKKGEIKFVKIGNSVRVTEEEIERIKKGVSNV